MSSYSTVKAANWRFVELGRIVLIDNKDLATVVEIIDQKRVCNIQYQNMKYNS